MPKYPTKDLVSVYCTDCEGRGYFLAKNNTPSQNPLAFNASIGFFCSRSLGKLHCNLFYNRILCANSRLEEYP